MRCEPPDNVRAAGFVSREQALSRFVSFADTNAGGQLTLSDGESETKFDSLVKVGEMSLASNRLVRVPSMKNMARLRTLWLDDNEITRITAGDFVGLTRLVQLTLGGNSIVSVEAQAFANLAALQVTPGEFKPTKANGSSAYQDDYGIGTCRCP